MLKEGKYTLVSKEEAPSYKTFLAGKVIVFSKELEDNILITKEEFYRNPKLYDALSKGRVTVRDKFGKTLSVKQEEAYKYKSLNKNTVSCINIITKEATRVPKEVFEVSEYLVGSRTKYIYLKDGKIVNKKEKPNTKISIEDFNYKKYIKDNNE